MKAIANPTLRSAFLVVAFFTLLAGDAWRYSVGWVGFGMVALALLAASVLLLIHNRERWRVGHVPYPLIAFLVLATASVAWSFYPGATALGVVVSWATTILAAAIAFTFSWREVVRGLGAALRVILGLSLLFELIVAVIVRQPVLPFVGAPGIDYSSYEKVPKLLYWSRNELFEVFDGGRIQGIVGNSSTLGFIALLALIVFAVQLLDGSLGRVSSVFWLALALASVVFTRSATITIGIAVVVVVGAAIMIVRAARSGRARTLSYLGIAAFVAIASALAIIFQGPLLSALGKSDTLTGRLRIWESVSELAAQRSFAGWGWVGYWVPWVAPFDTLEFNNGVRQLHAHNAWLDIWLQLGILGLLVVGALVLSTAVRSWFFAVDRPQWQPGLPLERTATSVLPLLILTALLVQSVAESRLLLEYGWALLAIIAIKTRIPDAAERESPRP